LYQRKATTLNSFLDLYLSPFRQRFATREIMIGDIGLGGNNPIRIQSMTNTDTNDIHATVAQTIALANAGCELVRITAQGEREAHNLALIKKEMRQKGYSTPLIADIHFNPKAAEIAASVVEKVRINPGNYIDRNTAGKFEFTDKEYALELEKIADRINPLLSICKFSGTAIRIGSNHGSLSNRIIGRYGDTPEGMVESALEFTRICNDLGFRNLVLSMKSSNVRVMVHATRLLVHKMMMEQLDFPIHLGVTEAGDGEDGIIKSAAGIGALLEDGIGDTIRVSLTGDPLKEIPVALAIAERYNNELAREVRSQKSEIEILESENHTTNPYRISQIPNPKSDIPIPKSQIPNPKSEIPIPKSQIPNPKSEIPIPKSQIRNPKSDINPFQYDNRQTLPSGEIGGYHPIQVLTLDEHSIHIVDENFNRAGIVSKDELSNILPLAGSVKSVRLHALSADDANHKRPILLTNNYSTDNFLTFQVNSAIDMGSLLIDGIGEAILLNAPTISPEDIHRTAFSILQATRSRITRTEYISCPSCGRTLFDIEVTLQKVKAATSHLKGLKIAVMGCIVNGPGEMADADFGYVGAGKGRVTLYKSKEVVERGIPEEEALEKLIELINRSQSQK
jgi:(E)-4-hydroxy-3-methylbut-2-enyl-diphosphate synthase